MKVFWHSLFVVMHFMDAYAFIDQQRADLFINDRTLLHADSEPFQSWIDLGGLWVWRKREKNNHNITIKWAIYQQNYGMCECFHVGLCKMCWTINWELIVRWHFRSSCLLFQLILFWLHYNLPLYFCDLLIPYSELRRLNSWWNHIFGERRSSNRVIYANNHPNTPAATPHTLIPFYWDCNKCISC